LAGFGQITTVDEAKTFYPLFGLGANVALIFSGRAVKYFSNVRSCLCHAFPVSMWDVHDGARWLHGSGHCIDAGSPCLSRIFLCGLGNIMVQGWVSAPSFPMCWLSKAWQSMPLHVPMLAWFSPGISGGAP
jgi:hypothetical protein